MARMVTGEELLEGIRAGTFVVGGDVGCAEGVKYDFRLSGRILKAKYGRPIDATSLPPSETVDLAVEPGEVVFVLTEERLDLPEDMVAQLSPKRKLSHAGVLTLGGFTVDPGYEGRLLIGLYNLSSTAFPLIPGKKLIAASFFRLEGGEKGLSVRPVAALEDFPDELVEVMQKYQPVGATVMAEAMQALEADVRSLRSELQSHSHWYHQFQTSLKSHDDQIGKLISGLDAEARARQEGEDKISRLASRQDEKFSLGIEKLTSGLDRLDKNFTFLKGAAWVIGFLLVALVLPVIVTLVSSYLSKP